MSSAREATARLVPLTERRLPDWCDRYLALPSSGDFFASRAWYDTLLAEAVPAGAEPVLGLCGALLLPLLRQGGRLGSLSGPYTLGWRPLAAPGADADAIRISAAAFGGVLRFRPPVRLDAMSDVAPALLAGLRQAGIRGHTFRHFANWQQDVAPGLGWAGYLAQRPPALRNTVQRKLARAARDACFSRITTEGGALEDGIAAYVAVRARSWKPNEAFPAFDGALMRASAGVGALRLGVLRRPDGLVLAAQYWVVTGGGATLLKLAHDAAERSSSPGTALTALMIRGLIEDDGVTSLDFGRGDDPYKQLWATRRRQRIGLMLASPLHPAGLLELARQAAGRLRARLRPAAGHA